MYYPNPIYILNFFSFNGVLEDNSTPAGDTNIIFKSKAAILWDQNGTYCFQKAAGFLINGVCSRAGLRPRGSGLVNLSWRPTCTEALSDLSQSVRAWLPVTSPKPPAYTYPVPSDLKDTIQCSFLYVYMCTMKRCQLFVSHCTDFGVSLWICSHQLVRVQIIWQYIGFRAIMWMRSMWTMWMHGNILMVCGDKYSTHQWKLSLGSITLIICPLQNALMQLNLSDVIG